MERDKSPVRKQKRAINAILKGETFEEILLVTIPSKKITEEQYDIILSWTLSENVHNDYLVEIDDKGKPEHSKWRDETLKNMPKTRQEWEKHIDLWNEFFEDPVEEAKVDEPSITIFINTFC